jgi:hypothetical protein
VNLDKDELAVDHFLEQTGIAWKHIFYSDPELRGSKNVVAKYYGVNNVPVYWLVDSEGKVRSIDVDPARLEQELVALATP